MLTTAHGDRSVLKMDENFPDPVAGDGEVIIDIHATAVNFHDLFTRRGMPGIKIDLPIIVGSDIAGVVSALGDGVDPAWMGKRVLVEPVLQDGRFGMYGETCHGGRAERIALPVCQLVEVPDGVELDQAAALPLAYGTAWRMLVTQGKIAAGETILILGASGGVGVACVQIAKMFGATVIACASSAPKIQRLKELGADHVVNYTEVPFREGVLEIVGKPRMATGKGGVNVAVNFTGGDTMLDTQKCVALGGRILCCGATAGYELSIDARYWWTFEHSMIGSDGWRTNDLVALMKAIDEGKLSPYIDKVFPLEESAEAERLLEDREVVGKILIRP